MMARPWLVLVLPIAAACGAAATARAPASDPLPGLWGVEPDFGPALAGRLRVTRSGTAEIGGVATVLEDAHGERRGRFAPSGAELRLRDDGGILRGFWIQPAGTTLQSGYATPIHFEAVGDGWIGEVRPLRDRIRLYLTIESSPHGHTAWIRETELNVGRHMGPLEVTGAPDALVFRTAAGGVAFTGRLAGDRLAIHIDDVTLDLTLTRRDRASAPGFYPRSPGRYAYRVPSPAGDGWPVASLGEVGIDPDAVTAAVQAIGDGVPTSPRSAAIHALVIARHGKLVLDEYFAGHTAQDTHDLRSAGKTLTTTLLGIASDRAIVSVEDRVADRLGHRSGDGPDDPRRSALQISHLASMSSGLDCDDDDEQSPGNEDVMQRQHAQPDWYGYTWALGFVREPGARAVYCTGAINLIGAVLGRTTDRWLPELFDDWIARPLQLGDYHWNLMPTGEGYMGGGARLRPRDFAKLAQLVIGHGTWQGRRIVSERWIATATAAHASIHEPDDYGYGWWRRRYEIAGRTVDIAYASGNGAQLSIAVPELDLVIAINAGNYGDSAVRRRLLDELVPALLAAAR